MLVRESRGQSQKDIHYEVFMIDFGGAWLRGHDESDQEWRKAKSYYGEDHEVGVVIQFWAKGHGVDIQWQEPRRWAGIWDWELHENVRRDE